MGSSYTSQTLSSHTINYHFLVTLDHILGSKCFLFLPPAALPHICDLWFSVFEITFSCCYCSCLLASTRACLCLTMLSQEFWTAMRRRFLLYRIIRGEEDPVENVGGKDGPNGQRDRSQRAWLCKQAQQSQMTWHRQRYRNRCWQRKLRSKASTKTAAVSIRCCFNVVLNSLLMPTIKKL